VIPSKSQFNSSKEGLAVLGKAVSAAKEKNEAAAREMFKVESHYWVTHQNKVNLHSCLFPYDWCRVSKDKLTVETSRGAEVPSAHVLQLLELVKSRIKIQGRRAGHFTVETEPDSEGFVKIGCHRVNVNQISQALRSYEILNNELEHWSSPAGCHQDCPACKI